jgi:predicted dehydrogenase
MAMGKNWNELSVLLVGCGSIGKRHARVLAGLGLADIRACDANEEQLASLFREVPNVKPYRSFEEGLKSGPDCVFILTPPKLHIPMATEALKAGCDVFSEKPLSDSLDGVGELNGLLANTKKKMMVGLCFRYHEGLRKAKEILERGSIGRLVSVRALMGEHLPTMRPDYKTLFTSMYSGAFDLMHDIDLAIWYADQPIGKVHALYGTYSDIGIQAPDVAEILIGFKDRCIASVHLDFFQRPRRRQMELIGTQGVITIEFASWDEYTLSVYTVNKAKWEIIKGKTVRDDMFRDEDMEFLKAVAGNKPIRCTVAEACKSLAVVLDSQK